LAVPLDERQGFGNLLRQRQLGGIVFGRLRRHSRVRVASCRERPTIKNSERRRSSQLIRSPRPRSGLSSRQVSVYLANGHLFSQFVKNGDRLRRNHQNIEILQLPVPVPIFHKLSRQRQ